MTTYLVAARAVEEIDIAILRSLKTTGARVQLLARWLEPAVSAAEIRAWRKGRRDILCFQVLRVLIGRDERLRLVAKAMPAGTMLRNYAERE
jgi:hypothetical protein